MQRAHAMPFGAEPTEAGVRFSLYAPSAREVTLLLDGTEHAMPDAGDGWRRRLEPEARAGSRYAFCIDGRLEVPDPASRFQPDDVHQRSAVVDPRAYDWHDAAWAGRPWEETVLYEAHVGTITPEGTFAALMGKLEDLKELGVTAIELMPLAEFAGRRNWGYDGVLPFAPDASYGTPEDLKRLVDAAHGLGLMVFIDVVYNHFGPSGNYLSAYAKPFFTERHHTPWGAAINFDGPDARPVRDFFIHNALYWLEEYHADGLRFDAVHAILDDSEPHILAEIAERARAALPGREIHLVLENDANEARWLERGARGRPKLHTAQWNDDIHHCWHVLLTGEAEGYYEDYADAPTARLARSLAEGFAYQGEASRHRGGEARGEVSSHLPPSAFVAFLQNHDQVGNRAFGERLSQLASPDRLALARAVLLLSPQIPLLFMGEEWNGAAPFLYFVDFADDTGLSDAVRNGRRQEFQRFKAFADPEAAARIPDPTAVDTYMTSVLTWDERNRPLGHAAREAVARLLRLRMAEVVPLTRSRFIGADHAAGRDDLVRVTWRYAAGSLSLVANLAEAATALEARPTGRPIWISDGVDTSATRLPPWSAVIVKDAPR